MHTAMSRGLEKKLNIFMIYVYYTGCTHLNKCLCNKVALLTQIRLKKPQFFYKIFNYYLVTFHDICCLTKCITSQGESISKVMAATSSQISKLCCHKPILAIKLAIGNW
jgi:hypothetical protein